MGAEIRVTHTTKLHKVELILNEESVSWLYIHDLDVKVGGVYLRMGGIGGVETLEAYRRKGYSRKVIEHSINYMSEKGYEVSILFGIPDYYVRWGYTSTLANYKITIPLRNAERASVGLHPRTMTDRDVNRIISIYELANSERTGPIRRKRGDWAGFTKGSIWGMPVDVIVFEDSSGEVVAYCAFDRWPRAMRVTEVGAKDVALYEHILRYACDMAFQKKVTELEIYVPFDHPLAELCMSLGCDISIEYPHASDGMGRIINLQSTFKSLIPELERRLRRRYSEELPSYISIETDIGLVTLDISDFGISISDKISTNRVQLPQWALMQLILGYRSPRNILIDRTVKHEGEVKEALDVLFQPGHPYVWHTDRF